MAEKRDIKCESCQSVFNTAADHGRWPRFCSRACYSAKAIVPEPKECPTCGGVFMAGRSRTAQSEDGRRIYCSTKCAHAGQRLGEDRVCRVCGDAFYLPASRKREGKSDWCSRECYYADHRDGMGPNFKGGAYLHTQSGEKFVRVGERPGYASLYTGEHRAVAMRLLGRVLERGEVVLRINRDPSDNHPENLFLTEIRDAAKRKQGSLPWPTKSNLVKA